MTGSLLHDWFGWDSGSVLTNLVAWIIGLVCGLGPTIWRIRKRIDRRLDEVHAHLEDVHVHVLDLHRHYGVETTPTGR
jgi:hypothetical protein